ncbi:MAG TPA: hypothetical protein VL490_08535 [Mucilaginibacter sp.]|jgi:hypothetical protein|nr:hypothetical protein [Mucilaginibacter sp.]
MNWKIILQLSVFGLIMAFATISLIPEKFEFPFWLVIFVFCGYVIAKACTGKYFLHGFFIGIFNCVWITIVHWIFYDKYAANHPDMTTMYTGTHPRLVMSAMGAAIGVVSGLVLGLIAFYASKMVKKNLQETKDIS